jgi:hypothetical protein
MKLDIINKKEESKKKKEKPAIDFTPDYDNTSYVSPKLEIRNFYKNPFEEINKNKLEYIPKVTLDICLNNNYDNKDIFGNKKDQNSFFNTKPNNYILSNEFLEKNDSLKFDLNNNDAFSRIIRNPMSYPLTGISSSSSYKHHEKNKDVNKKTKNKWIKYFLIGLLSFSLGGYIFRGCDNNLESFLIQSQYKNNDFYEKVNEEVKYCLNEKIIGV